MILIVHVTLYIYLVLRMHELQQYIGNHIYIKHFCCMTFHNRTCVNLYITIKCYITMHVNYMHFIMPVITNHLNIKFETILNMIVVGLHILWHVTYINEEEDNLLSS